MNKKKNTRHHKCHINEGIRENSSKKSDMVIIASAQGAKSHLLLNSLTVMTKKAKKMISILF
jgi:hypothetical protein